MNGGRPAVPTVLNVAEKPSVARALAAVLSRMPGAREGSMRREAHQIFTHDHVCFPLVYSQGDGRIHRGPSCSPGTFLDVKDAPHNMITTSVRGHLASQDFDAATYGWNKCDPLVLFDAPIETAYREDMVPLERMLRNLARTVQVVILWLDCDREGEAIGDEVRTVCLQANPRLEIFRARFSTVLAAEIQRALQSLDRLNENFVQAVQARSELDLRVGAAFTRFQTLRLQRKFEGFSDQGQGVVSYGPCQFPTLGFVVERWARIEAFVPEAFWYLDLSLTLDNVPIAHDTPAESAPPPEQRRNHPQPRRTISFTWKRGRLYDQISTLIIYEMCLEAGEAIVTNMQGRPKNRWRPVPLATVELQKRASRFLRVGSETLMGAAEELYQQGLISYPRTETEKFRPEFEHLPLIQQLATIPGEIGQYAQRLLTDNHFQLPRAGQNDDQAHPPITPCKAIDPSTIENPTHRSVYLLVVKHYLACCSRDAVGRETQLTVRIATEEFNATGLMILERNWLEIYHPWEGWSTGQGELPAVEVGSRIVPTSLLMKDGTTTPPQPISEVELISIMDRNKIGTDATIAQHISTIQEREYATKDANQRFLPTPLGIALVDGYNRMGYQLNKPDLRREMEAECNDIAAGRKTKDQVVETILAKMKVCYQTAVQEAHKLDEAIARHFQRLGASEQITQNVQENFSICGLCNSGMTLKQDRQARGGRNGYRRKLVYCATCRAGWNLPRGGVTAKMEGGNPVRCPICNYQAIQILRGEGYEGNGYHVCPKCFSDPPLEHGGAPNAGEFRCFACQHPTCPLASGTPNSDVAVFNCPFCHQGGSRPANSGKVSIRKNSRGYVLSCNTYNPGQDRCSYTIWLPKGCQSVTVSEGDENQNNLCPNCSTTQGVVRKVTFLWKPASVPPHLGRESTVCVLCDVDFRRDVQISLPQPNQVTARPVRQQQQQARTRNNEGGRGRGSGGRGRATGAAGRGNHACFKCGQPGHYANNCPNSNART